MSNVWGGRPHPHTPSSSTHGRRQRVADRQTDGQSHTLGLAHIQTETQNCKNLFRPDIQNELCLKFTNVSSLFWMDFTIWQRAHWPILAVGKMKRFCKPLECLQKKLSLSLHTHQHPYRQKLVAQAQIKRCSNGFVYVYS